MNISFAHFLAVAVSILPATLYAAEPSFANWISDFKREAAAKGVSQGILEDAFRNLAVNERVIELDRRQPEGTMTFAQYKERIVSKKRVEDGRRMLAQHRFLLDKISKRYGVQPRFIVALWGIETNYGQNTGGFDVIEALATLAYEGRRAEFFRGELLNALKIAQDGHVPVDNMLGSWAGALGQCQFMPSSFLNFAQDGNGDGKKDIWHTLEDVFSSIANYLAQSGWNDDYTWGRRIQLPSGFDRSHAGLKQSRKLGEWSRLGVRDGHGGTLPNAPLDASLVFPDENANEAYLVYGNYKTVMKWNRSLYFATAVGLLSDAIAP